MNIVLFIILLLAAHWVHAQAVYKWWDAEGNVIYSESPPADEAVRAEPLELLPAPSPESIEHTRQRQAVIQATADDLEQARRERESAEQAARESKPAVTHTEIIYRDTGGSYFLPFYPYRWHRPGHGEGHGPGVRPPHGNRPERPGRPGHRPPGKPGGPGSRPGAPSRLPLLR